MDEQRKVGRASGPGIGVKGACSAIGIGRAARPGGSPEGQAALEAEVLRLRAKLARVRDQRTS